MYCLYLDIYYPGYVQISPKVYLNQDKVGFSLLSFNFSASAVWRVFLDLALLTPCKHFEDLSSVCKTLMNKDGCIFLIY